MTCGGRSMWFNKNHPDTLYFDQRRETHYYDNGKRTVVDPDVLGDFRNLPFDDETFWHVVFDPPHIKGLSESSYMFKKYGTLSFDWRNHITQGFHEAMRVLKPNGTLIFKWNEGSFKVSEVLKMIPYQPLYGHPTSKNGDTKWMAFIKRVVT